MTDANTTTITTSTNPNLSFDIASEKAKANPTIVLVLDYLAVGLIVGAIWYAGMVLKMVDPNIVINLLSGLLAGLGVYKATA